MVISVKKRSFDVVGITEFFWGAVRSKTAIILKLFNNHVFQIE